MLFRFAFAGPHVYNLKIPSAPNGQVKMYNQQLLNITWSVSGDESGPFPLHLGLHCDPNNGTAGGDVNIIDGTIGTVSMRVAVPVDAHAP